MNNVRIKQNSTVLVKMTKVAQKSLLLLLRASFYVEYLLCTQHSSKKATVSTQSVPLESHEMDATNIAIYRESHTGSIFGVCLLTPDPREPDHHKHLRKMERTAL